jgi:hypothetical protein
MSLIPNSLGGHRTAKIALNVVEFVARGGASLYTYVLSYPLSSVGIARKEGGWQRA